MRNLRDIWRRLCKRAALSVGALFGNLEGVCLQGLRREKETAYLVSFSWTQRTLKVEPGGHLELKQGTGLLWVDIRLWGTLDSIVIPRCFGTVRARTQILINLYNGPYNAPSPALCKKQKIRTIHRVRQIVWKNKYPYSALRPVLKSYFSYHFFSTGKA
jgi:hypothetical protein